MVKLLEDIFDVEDWIDAKGTLGFVPVKRCKLCDKFFIFNSKGISFYNEHSRTAKIYCPNCDCLNDYISIAGQEQVFEEDTVNKIIELFIINEDR